MRVSKEQAAENRDRVVAVASRLLRERGIDGIGVDALMQAAGLTHGGFYKSFDSKDALVTEACARAMADSAARWASPPEGSHDEIFGKWVRGYLSPEHCAAAGEGCVFAALATDAGRRRGPLRRVFTDGLRVSVERLASLFPGRSKRRRERALATMAALVGAVVLARATEDDEMRAELLSATSAMLLQTKGAASQ